MRRQGGSGMGLGLFVYGWSVSIRDGVLVYRLRR